MQYKNLSLEEIEKFLKEVKQKYNIEIEITDERPEFFTKGIVFNANGGAYNYDFGQAIHVEGGVIGVDRENRKAKVFFDFEHLTKDPLLSVKHEVAHILYQCMDGFDRIDNRLYRIQDEHLGFLIATLIVEYHADYNACLNGLYSPEDCMRREKQELDVCAEVDKVIKTEPYYLIPILQSLLKFELPFIFARGRIDRVKKVMKTLRKKYPEKLKLIEEISESLDAYRGYMVGNFSRFAGSPKYWELYGRLIELIKEHLTPDEIESIQAIPFLMPWFLSGNSTKDQDIPYNVFLKRHLEQLIPYVRSVIENGGRVGILMPGPPRVGGTTGSLTVAREIGYKVFDGFFRAIYTTVLHKNIEHAINIWDNLEGHFGRGLQLLGVGYASKVAREIERMINTGEIEELVHMPYRSAVCFGYFYAKNNNRVRLEPHEVKKLMRGEVLETHYGEYTANLIGMPIQLLPIEDIDPWKYNIPRILIIDEDIALDGFLPKSFTLVTLEKKRDGWHINLNIDEKIAFIFRHIRGAEALEGWLLKIIGFIREFMKNEPIPSQSIRKEYLDSDIAEPELQFFKDITGCLPPPPEISVDLASSERPKNAPAQLYYKALALAVSASFFKGWHFKVYKNKAYLSLIADEHGGVLYRDVFDKYNVIIIRCNDVRKGVNFLKAIGVHSVYTIDYRNFPQRNIFFMFSHNSRRAISALYRRGIPSLIITRNKSEAEDAKEWCDKRGIQAYIVHPGTDPFELEKEAIYHGKCLILYEKSTMSRGIDIPYYYVAVVWSADYYLPYEEYMIDVDDPEKWEKVKNEKLMAELEQNILRTCPVRREKESSLLAAYYNSLPRFVIIPKPLAKQIEKGVRKFKFLGNDIIDVKRENLDKLLDLISHWYQDITEVYPVDGRIKIPGIGYTKILGAKEDFIRIKLFVNYNKIDERCGLLLLKVISQIFEKIKEFGAISTTFNFEHFWYILKKCNIINSKNKILLKRIEEAKEISKLINSQTTLLVDIIKMDEVSKYDYNFPVNTLLGIVIEPLNVTDAVRPGHIYQILSYMVKKWNVKLKEIYKNKSMYEQPYIDLQADIVLEKKILENPLNISKIWKTWIFNKEHPHAIELIKAIISGKVKWEAVDFILEALYKDLLEKDDISWLNYSEFGKWLREKGLQMDNEYLRGIIIPLLIESGLIHNTGIYYRPLWLEVIEHLVRDQLSTKYMVYEVPKVINKLWNAYVEWIKKEDEKLLKPVKNKKQVTKVASEQTLQVSQQKGVGNNHEENLYKKIDKNKK